MLSHLRTRPLHVGAHKQALGSASGNHALTLCVGVEGGFPTKNKFDIFYSFFLQEV